MDSQLSVIRIENDHCRSNCYLVSLQGSQNALVIDPADDRSGRISARIAESGYLKLLVALTHEHFDHMSGVNRLRECFDTLVIASETCSRSISDPKKNLSRYSIGVDIRTDAADLLWEDCGRIDWGGMRIEYSSTPGHSPGSVCFTVNDLLFSGDTLILGVPTVVKLPGGSRHDRMNTTARLFTRFGADTIVYPGHGEIFRLGQLDPAVVLGEVKAEADDRSFV